MPSNRLEYTRGYAKRPYVIEKERLRSASPDRKRSMFSRHLSRQYGITFDRYTEMLIEQAGCCALCERPMTALREPQVDHCHKTGKVRSLLCFACNLMIANAKENTDILRQGIEYIVSQFNLIEGMRTMNFKGLSGADLEISISQFAKELGQVMRNHMDKYSKTCVNCERFDQTRELCGIYNARPPAVVIVIGCEKHKEIDDIPF